MEKKKYLALIAIVVFIVALSGCTSSNTTTSTVNQTTYKITDDMIRIKADVWEGTPENTPLFEAGYPASIEAGNITYFVDDSVYQPLIQYFGINGTDKPFYAKVETRQVLLNPDAKIIVEVFDLEGKPL